MLALLAISCVLLTFVGKLYILYPNIKLISIFAYFFYKHEYTLNPIIFLPCT